MFIVDVRVLSILFLVFCGGFLCLTDYLFTYYGVVTPGVEELNPLVSLIGLNTFFVVKIFFVIWLGFMCIVRGWGLKWLFIVCNVFFFNVLWNTYQVGLL